MRWNRYNSARLSPPGFPRIEYRWNNYLCWMGALPVACAGFSLALFVCYELELGYMFIALHEGTGPSSTFNTPLGSGCETNTVRHEPTNTHSATSFDA